MASPCTPLPCTNIFVQGTTVYCDDFSDRLYSAFTNSECPLLPDWVVDTQYVSIVSRFGNFVELAFKKPGNTWVKAQVNNGCEIIADSLLVTIRGSLVVLDLGPDTSLCPGDTLQLRAPDDYVSYRWQDGSANAAFLATSPGSYYVTATDVCGNLQTDTVVVSSGSPAVLRISPDTTICAGSALQLQASGSFNQIAWYVLGSDSIIGSTATLPVRLVKAASYRATARSADGCQTSDTTNIQVFAQPSLSLGPDRPLCVNDTIVLKAPPSFVQYLWSNGSALDSIIVTTLGSYWVAATDSNGCVATDTVNIARWAALPKPFLGNDRGLCTSQSVVLDAGSYSSYLWQDGSTDRFYTVSSLGLYSVVVTDTNQCVGTDSIRFNTLLPTPQNFLLPADSLCPYSSVDLMPLRLFAAYEWSTGDRTFLTRVNTPGIYSLRVIDENNCAGIDSIEVIGVKCIEGLYVPNAFTPNNDGLNDVFRANAYGQLIGFRLEVYNRFGERVFTSTNIDLGWDGRYKAQPMPAGNYVWYCRYQLQGQPPAVQKGNLLLIR